MKLLLFSFAAGSLGSQSQSGALRGSEQRALGSLNTTSSCSELCHLVPGDSITACGDWGCWMQELPQEQPCVCTVGHHMCPWNDWSFENIGGGTSPECPWNLETQRCDFEEAAAWLRDFGDKSHPYLKSVYCGEGCWNGQVYRGGSQCSTTTTTTGPPRCTAYTPTATCDRDATIEVFDRVRGGCTGVQQNDVCDKYFEATAGSTEQECAMLCAKDASCTGFQFGPENCKLWSREIGTAVASDSNAYCYRKRDCLLQAGGTSYDCGGLGQQECSLTCPVGYSLVCKGEEYSGSETCWGSPWWQRAASLGYRDSTYRKCCACEKVTSDQIFVSMSTSADLACRGANPDDNDPSHFVVEAAASLEDCKLSCLAKSQCKGIEYSAGRCEVWTRAEGIGATVERAGHQCLKLSLPEWRIAAPGVRATTTTTTTTTTPEAATTTPTGPRVHHHMHFIPMNGGSGRACRGAASGDNNPAHYDVFALDTIEDCKAKCISTVRCVGIEYSSGRCEIWTRELGIGAFIILDGFSCLRFTTDIPPGQTCARWESIIGTGCADTKLCVELQ